MKRMIFAVLTALLALGLWPSALAAEESEGSFDRFAVVSPETYRQFRDIDESKWYGAEQQGVIQRACDLGILHGMEASRFLPEGNLRVSEAIKIACVVHGIYTTGNADIVQPQPGKNWAAPYIAYALEQGIIQEGDFADYGAYATRAQMAYIFAHCLPEEALPAMNTIAGIEEVKTHYMLFPHQYAEEIFLLYRAGVLLGDQGTRAFRPDAEITRAETAAIVTRLTDPSQREHFEILLRDMDMGCYRDFAVTNERGETICLGQQPYEDVLAFLEGRTPDYVQTWKDEEVARTEVRETYSDLEIIYAIGDINPTDAYVYGIIFTSQAYHVVNGITVGDSGAALEAKYEPGQLTYSPPEPLAGDGAAYFDGSYSYSPDLKAPDATRHYSGITYIMEGDTKDRIKEISMGCKFN